MEPFSAMTGSISWQETYVSKVVPKRMRLKIHRQYFKNKCTGDIYRTRLEKSGSNYYHLDDKNHTKISRYKLLRYWTHVGEMI